MPFTLAFREKLVLFSGLGGEGQGSPCALGVGIHRTPTRIQSTQSEGHQDSLGQSEQRTREQREGSERTSWNCFGYKQSKFWKET